MRSNPSENLMYGMVHSWDYFAWSFPKVPDFSTAQTYVPNGFIELVFLDGINIYEALPDQDFEQHPRAFVWGQTKQGNKIVMSGTGHWFEIKLYPWAFNLLFGHTSASLKPGGTDLRDLNEDFDLLWEKIMCAPSPSLAFEEFKKFAIQRLKYKLKVKPFIIHAFKLLYQSGGQIKINELCEQLNVSRQHTHQYFKESIGLSPKAYSRIIRLRHTVDQIYTSEHLSLTQIALNNGYFDQAHFISDFRSILGQSPKSFFKQKQFIYWDL